MWCFVLYLELLEQGKQQKEACLYSAFCHIHSVYFLSHCLSCKMLSCHRNCSVIISQRPLVRSRQMFSLPRKSIKYAALRPEQRQLLWHDFGQKKSTFKAKWKSNDCSAWHFTNKTIKLCELVVRAVDCGIYCCSSVHRRIIIPLKWTCPCAQTWSPNHRMSRLTSKVLWILKYTSELPRAVHYMFLRWYTK